MDTLPFHRARIRARKDREKGKEWRELVPSRRQGVVLVLVFVTFLLCEIARIGKSNRDRKQVPVGQGTRLM